MDVADPKPLSGIRYCIDTHKTVGEQLFSAKDRNLSTAVLEVDVFGSRAANQAQNVLSFGCLQRVYG